MSTHPTSSRRVRALAAFLVAGAAVALALTAPTPANASAAAHKGTETYIRGVAVNAANGNPLRGIRVTIRDVVTLDVVGSDITNRNGVYRVEELDGEEFGVKFNGSERGFETGFMACDRTVVPTWGEACSQGTGNIGRARLDRL